MFSFVRLTTPAAVLAVLLTFAPAPALAAPIPALAAPRAAVAASTVDVQTTATDIIAPTVTTVGTVTFRVSTTDASSGWVGLLRLRGGATWEDFRDAYRKVGSTDRATILEGSRELAESADLLGGVQTHVGSPGTFTQRLDAGNYILFEHQDFRRATEPRHRTLQAAPSAEGTDSDGTVDAVIKARVVEGVGPRYVLSGTFRVGSPIRLVNAMSGQANEALLWQMTPGATEADLKAWISQFGDTGQFPTTPPPFS
jgi:hypothetical protein